MAKEKVKEREKRSRREERKVKRKQSRVSLETHSKPARAYAGTHAKRHLPCTCTYDEAGAAADAQGGRTRRGASLPQVLRGDDGRGETGGPRSRAAVEFHADETGGWQTRGSASPPQGLRGDDGRDEAGGPRGRDGHPCEGIRFADGLWPGDTLRGRNLR